MSEREETKRYVNAVRKLYGKHIKITDTTPIVVGFVGDLRAEDLTGNQIKYLRGFYGVSEDVPCKILEDFPAERINNQSGKLISTNHRSINNYLQFG